MCPSLDSIFVYRNLPGIFLVFLFFVFLSPLATALRRIDHLTALALVCETEDFRMFPDAGAFMSAWGWYRVSSPAGK
jgi:hypothetical protein